MWSLVTRVLQPVIDNAPNSCPVKTPPGIDHSATSQAVTGSLDSVVPGSTNSARSSAIYPAANSACHS